MQHLYFSRLCPPRCYEFVDVCIYKLVSLVILEQGGIKGRKEEESSRGMYFLLCTWKVEMVHVF